MNKTKAIQLKNGDKTRQTLQNRGKLKGFYRKMLNLIRQRNTY